MGAMTQTQPAPDVPCRQCGEPVTMVKVRDDRPGAPTVLARRCANRACPSNADRLARPAP